MTDLLQPFLDGPARSLPGRLVYAKVWGSHSHGTQLETSDVDYLAVFQQPTRVVLGLGPWRDGVDGKAPDYQCHEVGKLAGLLLKGNPGVVEMLFTEQMQVTTPGWDALRAFRRTFINQTTLGQYLGYCDDQLRRHRAGNRLHTAGGAYNTKWAYHLLRLVRNAERMVLGGDPVMLEAGDDLGLLQQVRAGALSPLEVEAAFAAVRARVAAAVPALPPAADLRRLEEWLWQQRLDYLE